MNDVEKTVGNLVQEPYDVMFQETEKLYLRLKSIADNTPPEKQRGRQWTCWLALSAKYHYEKNKYEKRR